MFKKIPKIIKSSALFGLSLGIVLGSMSGWVFALGEGQIEGGDIYRIKNITKNLDYSKIQTASKCDVLQYKIRLHNPGPGVVSNVNVKASLSGLSSVSQPTTTTISAQNSQPATTSASANLTLSTAQKVSYIGGSTKLLDTYSNQISSLPDGVVGSGVNIGSVGVSLQQIRFVTFQVKVECPVTPPPPVDVCPNIDGVQTTIPAGYIKDANGKCVLPPPPVDVCPNIAGNQATIPSGMIKDANGNCVTPPVDVCPNIDGVQTTIPAGYIKDANGKCVPKPVVSEGICKSLVVTITDNTKRQVSATVTGQVTNATIEGYTIDWGDNTKSHTQTASHTYASNGTYSVVGTVKVKLADGTIVYRSGSTNCTKNVTFNNVPPVDVCPNIDGVQSSIPAGMIKDANGNCVTPPVDVCPNIDGVQTTIPVGYIKDANGKCVLPPPPVDVCPNIAGNQTTVPYGYIKDNSGNCVKKPHTVDPKYTCDYLDISATQDKTVRITQFVVTAQNGATFKEATIVWGDGKVTTVNDPVGQTHQYTADGTYSVRVNTSFIVNGVERLVDGSSCNRTVVFVTTKPPVVKPPAVVPPVIINNNNTDINNNNNHMIIYGDTDNGNQALGARTGSGGFSSSNNDLSGVQQLPDTGPGSVAVVFLAVTGLSTAGYYFLARRFA